MTIEAEAAPWRSAEDYKAATLRFLEERLPAWARTLWFKRYANASNLFILETDDPKRLSQLLSHVRAPWGEAPLASIATSKMPLVWAPGLVLLRLQERSRLVELSHPGAPFATVSLSDLGGVTGLGGLLKLMRTVPVTVVGFWLLDSRPPQELVDFLVVVSQDDGVYKPSEQRHRDGRLRAPVVIDQPSTLILLANDAGVLPEAVISLSVVINVPSSTPEERRALLEWLANTYKRLYGVEVRVDPRCVDASSGLNLHEVETAAFEGIVRRRAITVDDFKEFKIEKLRRLGLEYVEPRRGFESVGGYDYLKKWLMEEVVSFYRRPELAERYGVTPPRGLLLFGPPGTGKSWLARALAKELGVPMVSLNASDVLRGIVGESERRARMITKTVDSLAPIILFIDEADQIFMSRSLQMSTDSGVFRRVQGIFLDWMGREDRKTLVVMATNYPEHFDFASVRAGRVNAALPVLLPDAKARAEILRIHLEVIGRPRVPVRVDYEEAAEATAGFTGAELALAARKAKVLAAMKDEGEIRSEHVLRAASMLRVDRRGRVEMVRRMIERARSVETVVVPGELLEEAERALRELEGAAEERGRLPF